MNRRAYLSATAPVAAPVGSSRAARMARNLGRSGPSQQMTDSPSGRISAALRGGQP